MFSGNVDYLSTYYVGCISQDSNFRYHLCETLKSIPITVTQAVTLQPCIRKVSVYHLGFPQFLQASDSTLS
jgi:hypothetical protein